MAADAECRHTSSELGDRTRRGTSGRRLRFRIRRPGIFNHAAGAYDFAAIEHLTTVGSGTRLPTPGRALSRLLLLLLAKLHLRLAYLLQQILPRVLSVKTTRVAVGK